ncbi:adhesion G protein-coupled receptor E1-like [Haliotis cracherodii]|uniref:adhesion G protein-coupled receptor E1-like n=1 Tax=Haliotis cracherodii TaxID=6455 RepID=UPI0039ED045B
MMTTSLLVLLVSACAILSPGASLQESCQPGSNACPPNSACKVFNNKQECLCNPGFQPSSTGSQCLKIVELGGDCADATGTTCRHGPWGKAECISGSCNCSVALGYERASNNRCKDAPITVGFALHGEECSASRLCQFALTQHCVAGKCTCKPGLKKAGEDIQSAKPFVDECVMSDIVIGTP